MKCFAIGARELQSGKKLDGLPSRRGQRLPTIEKGILVLLTPPLLAAFSILMPAIKENLSHGDLPKLPPIAKALPRAVHRTQEVKSHLNETVFNFLKRTVRTGIQEGELARVASIIVAESSKRGYDPLFIASLIKEESTFKREAISQAGARGLMQIMPATGAYVSFLKKISWEGAHKLHDPEYNLLLGMEYLSYLRKKFDGDLRLALLAYNWGPGNLGDALHDRRPIPASVERYARQILTRYDQWRAEAQTVENQPSVVEG